MAKNGKAAPESSAVVNLVGWLYGKPLVSESDDKKTVTRVAFMMQTSRALDKDKAANLLMQVKVFGDLAEKVADMNLDEGSPVALTGYLNNERMTRGAGKNRTEVETSDGKAVYEHYVSLDDSFGSIEEVDLGDKPELRQGKKDAGRGKGDDRASGRSSGRGGSRASR